MTESRSTIGSWIAFLAGLVLVGMIGWVLLGRNSLNDQVNDVGPGLTTSKANFIEAPTAPAARSALPVLEIAAGGRLRIRRVAISERGHSELGPLEITLGLSDLARGDGNRGVRIVSMDGRKLEVLGSPRSEPGSGILLAIDPDFLTIGRYLIEVDTADKHALRIRRYVLEIE